MTTMNDKIFDDIIMSVKLTRTTCDLIESLGIDSDTVDIDDVRRLFQLFIFQYEIYRDMLVKDQNG